jgi:gentisate 1,2-dioxygenase
MVKSVPSAESKVSGFEADGYLLEYTAAVNPKMAPVPAVTYASKLHREGVTRVIPFDLSDKLQSKVQATSPNVCAAYIKILPQELITTTAKASAQLFYVIRGSGTTEGEFGSISWAEGDVFCLPYSGELIHKANADTAIYWVSDEPLLQYLGAEPVRAHFAPTKYSKAAIMAGIKEVDSAPEARYRNRDAVILANKQVNHIISATPTIWATVVLMNVAETQRPHRHNSVAVDIVIAAEKGCYTLLGKQIDEEGNIINPQRIDWEAGAAFVTPPGLWHGHYNESGAPAMVMAVQDAGLHENMRTLDIRFSPAPNPEYKGTK